MIEKLINYKIDTHIHTSEVSSCGKVRAEEMVGLYKDAGYDAVIVTDHYYSGFFETLENGSWEDKIDSYLSGYRAASEAGKKEGLNVLLGIELRFSNHPNDFLLYGIDEDFLYNNPELYKMTPAEFTEFKKGKGIALFQAHPFRKKMEIEDNSNLDGIEVINGNPRHDSKNSTAYTHALNNRLRMISGSDFHQYPDLARGGLIINEKTETSKDFAEYILQNKKVSLLGESLLYN